MKHYIARKLYAAPSVEPVSLAEAKAHVRVDGSDEDSLLTALVSAARQHIETITWRALIDQTWDLYLDRFPDCDQIVLPFGLLRSVSAFEWTRTDLVTSTWTVGSGGSAGYLLDSNGRVAHIDTVNEPGVIHLAYQKQWPSDVLIASKAIHIRAVFGYGSVADDVPQPLKHAIKLVVGHWFANREAVSLSDRGAVANTPLPLAVDALLAPYRIYPVVDSEDYD